MKTLHDEHFGFRPLCLIFLFAVIISEINPTDYKSITARHSPRDNKQVEADFSIWRDYGPSTPLLYASCLVPGFGKYEGLL